MRIQAALSVVTIAISSLCSAQDASPSEISKIRTEGLESSKVMDLAFHLTDVSGPRLTASPAYKKAANWAAAEMKKMGMQNVSVIPWGEFGQGWEQKRCYVAMTSPYYAPIIGIPRAWTGSTPGNGIISSDVIVIKAKDSAELQKYAGKLGGKAVLMFSSDTLKPSFTADGERMADSSLAKLANAGPPQARPSNTQQAPNEAARQRQAFPRILQAFFKNEKPSVVFSMVARGNDGTIFVQNGGAYTKDAENTFAWVMLSSDDYLRMQRLAESGIPVKVETDVKTQFYKDDMNGYNVIGEIPGTDPVLKNEIVMLGGHLDSWHGATGATDNAAGCAVMMEAAKILQASGLKPKRTIRVALWGGEEQGLIGSRAYVKANFADPADMVLKPAHEKVSAYYNLDNGTGRIRGIYLQGNTAAGPLFTEWLKPFHDLDAKTVTISNTGGTDHLAFDAVGIPGFQFIQDPIEYNTRTHHTNMDTYDHLIPQDLKQAATIVAAFVYQTAQRNEKIPRKELPKPRGR